MDAKILPPDPLTNSGSCGMMVPSIELNPMKLFLICEDVDLGYHCYGVFDNEDVAKEQMELLLASYASVRFSGQELPENYKDYFQLYINPFVLNDSSFIQGEIRDNKRRLEN